MILVGLLGLVACGDDDGSGPCTLGTEGCPCTNADRCNTGLVCASDRCVDVTDGGDIDSGTSGAGGSAGSAGSAGVSGSGGQGGTGTVPVGGACESTSECAQPSEPCLAAVCISRFCANAQQLSGTILPDDSVGDCQARQCDDDAQIQTIVFASDVPADDGDPCTSEICVGATPTHAPITSGALPADAQEVGDCRVLACEDGALVSSADPNDRPANPTECVLGTCNGTTPTMTLAPAGRRCGASQVCNGQGDCVACVADNGACDNSGQCCGGACMNQLCEPCADGFADCDGNSGNGCETLVSISTSCRSCGNDCTTLPNVANVSCGVDGCLINSCDPTWANADGNVTNGCEAPVTVGPGGAYGECDGNSALSACGVGEGCKTGAVNFSTAVMLSNCAATGADCYCAAPCTGSDATMCPMPSGGTATRGCAATHCYLDCGGSKTCPGGFTCKLFSLISGIGFNLCIPD